MKETFTLKDIEPGMLVLCEDEVYTVVPKEEMDGLILVSEGGFQPLYESYNDDLTIKRELFNGMESVAAFMDIKKVYGRTNRLGRGLFHSIPERKLLYDRDWFTE